MAYVASLRAHVVCRYGVCRCGGEFAVVAPGPAGDTDEAAVAAVAQLLERVTAVTAGTHAVGNVLFNYAGACVVVIAVDPNVREKHLDAESTDDATGRRADVRHQAASSPRYRLRRTANLGCITPPVSRRYW